MKGKIACYFKKWGKNEKEHVYTKSIGEASKSKTKIGIVPAALRELLLQ